MERYWYGSVSHTESGTTDQITGGGNMETTTTLDANSAYEILEKRKNGLFTRSTESGVSEV